MDNTVSYQYARRRKHDTCGVKNPWRHRYAQHVETFMPVEILNSRRMAGVLLTPGQKGLILRGYRSLSVGTEVVFVGFSKHARWVHLAEENRFTTREVEDPNYVIVKRPKGRRTYEVWRRNITWK